MNLKLVFHLLIALTLGVFLGYYFKETAVNSLSCSSICNSHSDEIQTLESHIRLIDLNSKVNENITCTKSKGLFDLFQTTICVHDSGKDIYVSQAIKNYQIWEEGLVSKILKILLKNPEFYFIDVGANIGTYTMYASSIGRKTIAIECYQPNIDRITRAVQIENVSEHVILIGNAIYNESRKWLQLSKDASNIGGQGLITNQTIKNASSDSKEFRVLSARFDDLYPIFVNNEIANAVMKIDIEGAEIFLYQSAHRIFDSVNIAFVQMEWEAVKLRQTDAEFVMDFFTKRDYLPVSTANCQILNSTTSNYTTWGTPHDIYWIKSEYYQLCKT